MTPALRLRRVFAHRARRLRGVLARRLPRDAARDAFPLRGAIDHIDNLGVHGWVAGGAHDQARMTIGGALTLPVTPDRPRPDVSGAGAAADPNPGFDCAFADLPEATRDRLAALFDGRRRHVVLWIGDTVVAERRVRLGPQFRIEARWEDGALRGWVGAQLWPHRVVSLEFLVDGHPVETERAVNVRPDLMKAHGLGWAAAFTFVPVCAIAPRNGLSRAAVRVVGALGETGAEASVRLPARAACTTEIETARAAPTAPVAVIAPIFNAADSLARCLESLRRHTPRATRLILIDDSSTDPRIGEILADYAADPSATIIRNAENLGYTRSVNRGIAAAGDADVVLLNSDTRVTPRWLHNLRLAAYGAPEIGTATALSDNAGAFSAPDAPGPNPLPEGLDEDAYARLVTQASGLVWPQTPTGNGFCLYIKRACLNDVGAFDEAAFPRGYGEENDFCMRALARGWRHVVDDRTLVHHERSASFGAERNALMAAGQTQVRARWPDYDSRVSLFRNGQPMGVARARIAEAIAAGRAGAPAPRPRALFVISTTAGGAPLTNYDLMGALADRYEPFLLQSDSRTLILSRLQDGELQEAARHHLTERIDPVGHRSAEYDRVLAEWLVAHAIELVHIRHIAWHSLGLPSVARSLAIPVVFSFHDYYAVCPTVKLLDEKDMYCAGRCTAPSGADCAPDLWPGFDTPPLKDNWVHVWRANMARMFEACDVFVTTSEAARALILEHFPTLASRPFHVVPHGRDFARLRPPAALETGGTLRVLAPNAISPAKGSRLIAEIATLDTEGRIEFHILGEADETLRRAAHCHGAYRREDFIRHVEDIRPQIGVVLSIWPETHCHTLTELWAAGLPVLGLDLGAVGERLRQTGAGWLAPAAAPDLARTLHAMLSDLAARPDAIRQAANAVTAWQAHAPEDSLARMADRYAAIYRETAGSDIGA